MQNSGGRTIDPTHRLNTRTTPTKHTITPEAAHVDASSEVADRRGQQNQVPLQMMVPAAQLRSAGMKTEVR